MNSNEHSSKPTPFQRFLEGADRERESWTPKQRRIQKTKYRDRLILDFLSLDTYESTSTTPNAETVQALAETDLARFDSAGDLWNDLDED